MNWTISIIETIIPVDIHVGVCSLVSSLVLLEQYFPMLKRWKK